MLIHPAKRKGSRQWKKIHRSSRIWIALDGGKNIFAIVGAMREARTHAFLIRMKSSSSLALCGSLFARRRIWCTVGMSTLRRDYRTLLKSEPVRFPIAGPQLRSCEPPLRYAYRAAVMSLYFHRTTVARCSTRTCTEFFRFSMTDGFSAFSFFRWIQPTLLKEITRDFLSDCDPIFFLR